MAAETAAGRGLRVNVFDAMPSMGRKFLMAGKSGLNLTHAEPETRFMSRFGRSERRLAPIIAAFPPEAVRTWAAGLGVETFIGSSGRVFPVDFKAGPLLRAWIRRLRGLGVTFHVRHRWRGWDADGQAIFDTPDGAARIAADALILAMGGASWPRLGSDGAWTGILTDRGVAVAPLLPANCGFDVGWSDHFRARFAGQPVKPVILTSAHGSLRGEFVISADGVEGGGLYPHAAGLRDAIAESGAAILTLDLLPDHTAERLAAALGAPRGGRSLAEHLRRAAGLTGVKAGLLRECLAPEDLANPGRLARRIKALKLRLLRPRPIAEAISSAGGVAWDSLDDDLMLRALPGAFVAGEMIDWESPTGGYLLTACMALGPRAGERAAAWVEKTAPG
jgi:uncharacterized flavoprotein (TIGR03862 family)